MIKKLLKITMSALLFGGTADFGISFAANRLAADKIEIYSEGERFPSIKNYRLHRRLLESQEASPRPLTESLQESSPGPSNESPRSTLPGQESGFLINFLDATLKNFNDAELKFLLHELRKRRRDLFEDGPHDYAADMEEMLKDYHARSGNDATLDIDPSRIKTIALPKDGKGEKTVWFGDPDLNKSNAEKLAPGEKAEQIHQMINQYQADSAPPSAAEDLPPNSSGSPTTLPTSP